MVRALAAVVLFALFALLATLPSSTTPLTAIDRAAAELSAKIVPAVQAQLAAIAAAKKPVETAQTIPPQKTTPLTPTLAPTPLPQIVTSVAALHDSPLI